MTLRRLLPLLTLLALMLAPFGRIGIAEAAMPAHDMSAAASHCAGMPAPADPAPSDKSVDCMIACAVVAPLPACSISAPQQGASEIGATRIKCLAGIATGFDPPPPRIS